MLRGCRWLLLVAVQSALWYASVLLLLNRQPSM